MCMITFLPEGVEADETAIYNGTIFNDDGHGFAMIIDGELVVRRGFDAHSMVDLFVRLRNAYPDGPAMFHSRMATHGATDKSNVHPFYVGSDRRTVLVHNGIFATLGTKTSAWSDTRIFAQQFLPKRRDMNLLTRRGRIRAQKWIGSYNKVAVITTNPNSKLNSFILNENEGYWDGGAWYSGLDYLGAKYTKYAYGMGDYGKYSSEEWDADWFDGADKSRTLKELQDMATVVGGTVIGGSGKTVATDDDAAWDEYWSEHIAAYGQCKFCEANGTIDRKTGECAVCMMCNDCEQSAQFCACV